MERHLHALPCRSRSVCTRSPRRAPARRARPAGRSRSRASGRDRGAGRAVRADRPSRDRSSAGPRGRVPTLRTPSRLSTNAANSRSMRAVPGTGNTADPSGGRGLVPAEPGICASHIGAMRREQRGRPEAGVRTARRGDRAPRAPACTAPDCSRAAGGRGPDATHTVLGDARTSGEARKASTSALFPIPAEPATNTSWRSPARARASGPVSRSRASRGRRAAARSVGDERGSTNASSTSDRRLAAEVVPTKRKPAAVHGFDEARGLGLVAESDPQLSDRLVERVFADRHARPERVQELVFRRQHARPFGQILQDRPGLRAERNRSVAAHQPASAQIQIESEDELMTGLFRYGRLRTCAFGHTGASDASAHGRARRAMGIV